ncbi:kinase-like protein [Cystobasidium minutum MCA 4210]|uniref:kinase-like protein n=1 Tax=Cystobasidium minutum MCA 4210 TaxID=1397322 RepID=UPI0034CE4F7C|eukprot:jgi/Rhomi1/96774/CE96773_466
MHSKNDVFTTDWSIRPPPSITPVNHLNVRQPPRQVFKDVNHSSSTDTYGSSTTDNAPSAAPVKPSNDLEVRLLSKHELGHGRHATVHLALYRHREHERASRQSHDRLSSADDDNHFLHPSSATTKTWKICAAKRFAAGKDAEVAGLSEALMLTKLSKCRQVLQYIGLKDERTRPLSRPSTSRGNSSSSSTFEADTSANDQTNGSFEEDLTTPNQNNQGSPPSLLRAHSSTSKSTPSSPVLKPTTPNDSVLPTLFSLQQRQQAEESNTSKASTVLRRTATVKAPSQLGHSRRKPLTIDTNALSIHDDSPRLLLLTEYCHLGNLATFVLHHGEGLLGRKMFLKFAIDLMKALVAVHEKNIIHGDVKPQNCMIDSSFDLKLGDFSSSIFNHLDLVDGIGLGTTQYSSPEIVQMPPSPFSFPIDIFSAGLTLLFMITGVQPYESLTMASCNRSDRFTPKSPHSPRSTPGNVTPTSAMSSKRKYRSSSGAGKIVELQTHANLLGRRYPDPEIPSRWSHCT